MGGASDLLDVRWIGHATVLVELDGWRFLTDPTLTMRLAHLRRHHPVDVDAVRDVDVVLISHLHLDHLHVPSLRLLGDATIVVPDGAGRLLRRHRLANVVETRVGEQRSFGPVTVETVPAIHSASRGPHSRVRATAIGYVLRAPHASVYFAGDTDLFAGMAGLASIDVALLPIAGWGATVGTGHLDPDRAAQAIELIRPRLVVPIHWGTYSPIALRKRPPQWLTRPAQQFAAAMADSGNGGRLRLLEPGEQLALTTELPR